MQSKQKKNNQRKTHTTTPNLKHLRKSLTFFFLLIRESIFVYQRKVWFNLQSANYSHSLCTSTLPPGIPVLQSLETSFLRWACAGRFIWAWNCSHHRNIESNQARLQQKGHLDWMKLDILVVQ